MLDKLILMILMKLAEVKSSYQKTFIYKIDIILTRHIWFLSSSSFINTSLWNIIKVSNTD